MSGESRRKVDKQKLIDELIETVKTLDGNSSLSQMTKTKGYQRAAQKLRRRRYEDGRRSEASKLSLMAYRRYLSDVKKAVREQGWRHHGLEKSIDLLSRKYPLFSKRLHKLLSLNTEAMRTEHTGLCQYARDRYKETKDKKYRDAYTEFKTMKLDHDVLRQLAMQSLEKEDVKDADQEALTKKKSNTVTVNKPWILKTINELLESDQFSYKALGLALASGRRAVEILYQGRFIAADENTVIFTGQAKKQGGVDLKNKMTIYTLIPADEFCTHMKTFRKLKPVAALSQYDELPETQRNVEINRRTAKTLNIATKKVFLSDERMFKESRAIWARIVYEQHFKTDARWSNTDEDIFWQEMLGHEDTETQQHYKNIKLDYSDLPKESKPINANKQSEKIRVKRLLKMNSDYRIANRKALLRINEFVMKRIHENPEISINQTMISRELGANRVAIKDYLTAINNAYKGMLEKPTTAKPEEEQEAKPCVEKVEEKPKTTKAKRKPKTKK